MSTEFVKALDAEIDDLKRALAADIRYMRLQELERVKRLYVADTSSPRVAPAPIPVLSADISTIRTALNEHIRRARQRSPERQRVLNAVWELLIGKKEPIPTSFIYDHLIGEGIEVGGNDPKNNLSAMLSNSDQFQSHGRSGWTLAPAAVLGVAQPYDASPTDKRTTTVEEFFGGEKPGH
jgi:hypothetical protein